MATVQSFENQCQVVIPQALHGLTQPPGHVRILTSTHPVQVLFDSQTPERALVNVAIDVDAATGAVIITMAVPQSGQVLLEDAAHA